MFRFLCCILPAFAQLLHLRRTTIDLVLDFPACFISDYGIFTLACAEITAVTIDCFFLSRQQFRYFRNVVDIGRCGFHCVNHSAVLVHADMCLVPKVPGVTLLDLMGIRILFLLLILGRRWGRNDGGIYIGTLFQNEAALSFSNSTAESWQAIPST